MKAFIFTYGPDYPMAAIATSALQRLGVPATWVVDTGDSLPKGSAPLAFTSTPRCGKLNGIKWVITQLETMLNYSDGAEWVLKVDSDTMVLNLDWLWSVTHECDACGVYSNRRNFYGCCYALKVSAIPRLIEAAKKWANPNTHAEDLIVAELLDICGLSNIRHPYHSTRGVLGFWCGDRKDTGGHEVICVQRELITPLGHERDKVIESMKEISATAGIELATP